MTKLLRAGEIRVKVKLPETIPKMTPPNLLKDEPFVATFSSVEPIA